MSSKAIGDDLYYLTVGYFKKKEKYKSKYFMADFITPKAKEILMGEEKGKLVFEHMVPKNIYIKKISSALLEKKLSKNFIESLLNKYYYVCTVVESENDMLPTLKMGDEWDGKNPFYRYEKVGIEFLENY